MFDSRENAKDWNVNFGLWKTNVVMRFGGWAICVDHINEYEQVNRVVGWLIRSCQNENEWMNVGMTRWRRLTENWWKSNKQNTERYVTPISRVKRPSSLKCQSSTSSWVGIQLLWRKLTCIGCSLNHLDIHLRRRMMSWIFHTQIFEVTLIFRKIENAFR